MKKILWIICLLICLLGLSSCSQKMEVNQEISNQHVEAAKELASSMTSFFATFFDKQQADAIKSEHNAESLEVLFEDNYQIYVNGSAVLKGVDSFQVAYESFGSLISVDELDSRIDGDKIYIILHVTGEKKTGEIEYIFSNDYFLKLESATLNVDSTMGEKMQSAAFNTVIGLTVVFSVLFLISAIISSFTWFNKKTTKNELPFSHEIKPTATSITSPVLDPVAAEVNREDDLELVAVITAAIHAYREQDQETETQFVVRSIRKVRQA